MSTKKTFEENLQDLEAIVTKLETGDVALEDAIAEFQKGMALSKRFAERPWKMLKRHWLRLCKQMVQKRKWMPNEQAKIKLMRLSVITTKKRIFLYQVI